MKHLPGRQRESGVHSAEAGPTDSVVAMTLKVSRWRTVHPQCGENHWSPTQSSPRKALVVGTILKIPLPCSAALHLITRLIHLKPREIPGGQASASVCSQRALDLWYPVGRKRRLWGATDQPCLPSSRRACLGVGMDSSGIRLRPCSGAVLHVLYPSRPCINR